MQQFCCNNLTESCSDTLIIQVLIVVNNTRIVLGRIDQYIRGGGKSLVLEITHLYGTGDMTLQHENTFQYSEEHRVAIRYAILDLKGGLQLPCSWQHRGIIFCMLLSCIVLQNTAENVIVWMFSGRTVCRYGVLKVEAEASTDSIPRLGFTPRQGPGLFLFGKSQFGPPAKKDFRIDFQFDQAAFAFKCASITVDVSNFKQHVYSTALSFFGVAVSYLCTSAFFKPIDRLGHPENCTFLLY